MGDKQAPLITGSQSSDGRKLGRSGDDANVRPRTCSAVAIRAFPFGGADPGAAPFDDGVLTDSVEGFLEEAFEHLRHQYVSEGTPPSIGSR